MIMLILTQAEPPLLVCGGDSKLAVGSTMPSGDGQAKGYYTLDVPSSSEKDRRSTSTTNITHANTFKNISVLEEVS